MKRKVPEITESVQDLKRLKRQAKKLNVSGRT